MKYRQAGSIVLLTCRDRRKNEKHKPEPILRDSPEHVVDVMVSVMESLCFKIDIPAKERMQNIGGRKKQKLNLRLQGI